MWLNNGPIPADICEREPDLKLRGFYRRLNSGKLEFISFCNPIANDLLGIHKTDLEKILDALLPRKRGRRGD